MCLELEDVLHRDVLFIGSKEIHNVMYEHEDASNRENLSLNFKSSVLRD